MPSAIQTATSTITAQRGSAHSPVRAGVPVRSNWVMRQRATRYPTAPAAATASNIFHVAPSYQTTLAPRTLKIPRLPTVQDCAGGGSTPSTNAR